MRVRDLEQEWYEAEYGRSEEHAVRCSPEEEEATNAALDAVFYLTRVTLRLPDALIASLEAVGREQGLVLAAVIRKALWEYTER